MDTSSVCFDRLSSSSILFPTFSDQSHVDFYHLSSGSTSRAYRSLSLRSCLSGVLSSTSTWKPAVPPLRALSESACVASSTVLEPASEQTSLMKELADLKLQMKQKKKELKSQRKDEKKRLKMQLKEEKKATKTKDGTEGKKIKKCNYESSSSSESSDGDCESMSMRMLRHEHSLSPDYEGVPARVQDNGNPVDVCEESCGRTSVVGPMKMLTACAAEEGLSSIANGRLDFREISVQEDLSGQGVPSANKPRLPLHSASIQAPNRIEVCTGGKCKKAGSELLLSSLAVKIPSSSDVVAVPCKCMGKCAMAINAKVHKEDTNPQHHSDVRVEDADVILNHHFGLGRPPTGLPSFPSQERLRIPSPMSV